MDKVSERHDFGLSYHSGKANVVANALSRKSLHISAMIVKEFELLKEFIDLNLAMEIRTRSLYLRMWRITIDFIKYKSGKLRRKINFCKRSYI